MTQERRYIKNWQNIMNNRYLFCFTFAGGTAAFYDSFEQCLTDDIQVIKLDYSGHGKRHHEPLLSNFKQTADDLFSIITRDYAEIVYNPDNEVALMGYSMGSITAVEILNRFLALDGVCRPAHVFLAAHEPVSNHTLENLPEDRVDEYVKERTIAFGGIPDRLVHNKSFWRMYLPLYKADYLMIARYHFEELHLHTDIPVTIFYSESDTKYQDMQNWRKYFEGKCDYVEYKGSHFFIHDYYKEMSEVIKADWSSL